MSRDTLASERTDFAPAPRNFQVKLVGLPISVSAEGLACIATFALPLINIVGPIGVLAFFGSTSLVLMLRPLPTMRELLRFSPLFLLPVLAILSTIWSEAPQRSMRSGLELLLTIGAGIVICRNMRPERFILCLFVAMLLISATVAPNIPQCIATKYPLTASWGSKNQVGLFGFLLFALSPAIIFDRLQPWPARLIAPFAAVYALLVCYLAQSGGTTSCLVLMMIAFPPLALLAAMKPPLRIALVIITLLLILGASFFLSDISAAITDFRTTVLNKDATLTGRTYLWDFADRLSAGSPILGHGYFAFWRQGNIDAEGLWRWGGIASRGGFNFHNAFVGMRVDLGIVGVVILAGSCVAVMLGALGRQVIAPSTALACLISITLVNYVRTYVEEGLVSPFSVVTLVWLATILYALPARLGQSEPVSGERVRAYVADDPISPRKERWSAGIPRGKPPRRMLG